MPTTCTVDTQALGNGFAPLPSHRAARRVGSVSIAATMALIVGALLGIAAESAEATEQQEAALLLAQAGATQPQVPGVSSGGYGHPSRPPHGVVPVPVPVPVPGYYGVPTPHGYGMPGYGVPGYGAPGVGVPGYGYGGMPYGGYGYPGAYGTPPFGSQPYTGPKAGQVRLIIDPVDAKVFIDGQEVGQQPDLSYVVNLLEGRHRLQIAREGFKPHDQPLDVPGGGGLVLTVQMEK